MGGPPPGVVQGARASRARECRGARWRVDLRSQPPQPSVPGSMGPFWTAYPALCQQEDAAQKRPDKELREHVTVARIAALMQMLAPESAELRLGLVKYLTAVPHVEATKALARLAIYSPEDDVRAAALESLKVRREKDYTDILVKGLRYPWPAVAKRSAEAIAKLGRNDLIPELVAVLGETDPRLPVDEGRRWEEDRGRARDGPRQPPPQLHDVPRAARSGHHRAPAHSPPRSPIPGQPLPTPFQGYGSSSPDLMVRIDVTYLRQDFSAMLPVSVENPWPETQRFDFLVRERQLTCEEADDYRAKLALEGTGRALALSQGRAGAHSAT